MTKDHIFFNLFGMTIIPKSNFASSCIIRFASQFFRLWSTIVIIQFKLTLILQLLCAAPLYFPVISQKISYFNIIFNKNLSQMQHSVLHYHKSNILISNFLSSFLVITNSLLKCFLYHVTTIFSLFINVNDKHMHSILT